MSGDNNKYFFCYVDGIDTLDLKCEYFSITDLCPLFLKSINNMISVPPQSSFDILEDLYGSLLMLRVRQERAT